jgi:hypothetical protein
MRMPEELGGYGANAPRVLVASEQMRIAELRGIDPQQVVAAVGTDLPESEFQHRAYIWCKELKSRLENRLFDKRA